MFGELIVNSISDQHRSWDHTLPFFCDATTAWELQQNSTVTLIFNRFIFTLTQPIDFSLHQLSMLIGSGLIWASGSMFSGSQHGKPDMCTRTFDVGNDFSANQMWCHIHFRGC